MVKVAWNPGLVVANWYGLLFGLILSVDPACYLDGIYNCIFFYQIWFDVFICDSSSVTSPATSIMISTYSDDCRLPNWFSSPRKFPVILPHEVFPWLVRHGAWPSDDDAGPSSLEQYWNHFLGKVSWQAPPGLERDLHPIYLWGDDVQFNEHHEKLIVVLAGHVLDRRSYSKSSCWPLFTIREAAWLFYLYPMQPCMCLCRFTCIHYIYIYIHN